MRVLLVLLSFLLVRPAYAACPTGMPSNFSIGYNLFLDGCGSDLTDVWCLGGANRYNSLKKLRRDLAIYSSIGVKVVRLFLNAPSSGLQYCGPTVNYSKATNAGNTLKNDVFPLLDEYGIKAIVNFNASFCFDKNDNYDFRPWPDVYIGKYDGNFSAANAKTAFDTFVTNLVEWEKTIVATIGVSNSTVLYFDYFNEYYSGANAWPYEFRARTSNLSDPRKTGLCSTTQYPCSTDTDCGSGASCVNQAIKLNPDTTNITKDEMLRVMIDNVGIPDAKRGLSFLFAPEWDGTVSLDAQKLKTALGNRSLQVFDLHYYPFPAWEGRSASDYSLRGPDRIQPEMQAVKNAWGSDSCILIGEWSNQLCKRRNSQPTLSISQLVQRDADKDFLDKAKAAGAKAALHWTMWDNLSSRDRGLLPNLNCDNVERSNVFWADSYDVDHPKAGWGGLVAREGDANLIAGGGDFESDSVDPGWVSIAPGGNTVLTHEFGTAKTNQKYLSWGVLNSGYNTLCSPWMPNKGTKLSLSGFMRAPKIGSDSRVAIQFQSKTGSSVDETRYGWLDLPVTSEWTNIQKTISDAGMPMTYFQINPSVTDVRLCFTMAARNSSGGCGSTTESLLHLDALSAFTF